MKSRRKHIGYGTGTHAHFNISRSFRRKEKRSNSYRQMVFIKAVQVNRMSGWHGLGVL